MINSSSVVLSGAMMFPYAGWRDVASAIEDAIAGRSRRRRSLTISASHGRRYDAEDIGVRRRAHPEHMGRMRVQTTRGERGVKQL